MEQRFVAYITPLALMKDGFPHFTGYVYDWKLRTSGELQWKKVNNLDLEEFMAEFKKELLSSSIKEE